MYNTNTYFMRRLLLGILSLFLVTSLVPVYAAFLDVPSSHANANAILTLQADGVLQGYADGSFRPGNAITRAEFVKIIVAGRYPEATVQACNRDRLEDSFYDVDLNNWYSPYLCIALQEGLINGYPDKTFRPTDSINFAEAAAILARASREELGRKTTDTWYDPSVRWLDAHNAIPLSIKKPYSVLSRGDMAEIYYRIKHDDTQQPSRVAPELNETGDAPDNYLKLNFMLSQEAGATTAYFGYRELFLGKILLAEDTDKAMYTFQVKDINSKKPVVFGVYLQIEGKQIYAHAIVYDETIRSLRPMEFQHKDGTLTASVQADGISITNGEFSTSTPGVKTPWDVKNGVLTER